jgi:hypothetical protein
MELTNYPFDSQQINDTAQAQNVYDLKSAALVALLEQLGLTQPSRYVFVLRRWDPIFIHYGVSPWPDGIIPNNIVMRNFDPDTLNPSQYVNDAFYMGCVLSGFPDFYRGGEKINIATVIPVNPLAANASAVADSSINNLLMISPGILSPGQLFTGLTRDDVGGLRYLLSPENINYETLLRSVHSPIGTWDHGRHSHSLVNGAWRPGIDKLTLVPQPFNSQSGRFLPVTNRFTDVYIKTGAVIGQPVERLVTQPDILFCAADTGENSLYTSWVLRTGTADWLNNAALNGNTNGEGPGVIQPPIKITFHKLGPIIYTGETDGGTYNPGWGTFDDSTNLPVLYPSSTQSIKNLLTVRLRFFDCSLPNLPDFQLTHITWRLRVPIGGLASLQISTNRIDWTSLATVTNSGSVIEWYYYGTENPPKHFRVMPQ